VAHVAAVLALDAGVRYLSEWLLHLLEDRLGHRQRVRLLDLVESWSHLLEGRLDKVRPGHQVLVRVVVPS